MSVFIDEFVDRLPMHSALRKPFNQGRVVLDRTVGEWMDNFDESELWEGCFLTSAEGKYLDLWGRQFKVSRKENESDEDYRQRIIYESLGHLTADYLLDVFNVGLFVFVTDFDATDNMLTSDNPHLIGNEKFMISCDTATKELLLKKFVIGGEIVWLTP